MMLDISRSDINENISTRGRLAPDLLPWQSLQLDSS